LRKQQKKKIKKKLKKLKIKEDARGEGVKH